MVQYFARVNALCNLLRKKLLEVAASLLGRFLSRCCLMLCITMEVEPSIAKQYKCHHCCSCKNYQGKGMEGGKKSVFASFLADQKIASSWEFFLFWASYSMSSKLLLVVRHILTTGLQKCLSNWQFKICKFTITAFHCEEKLVCTRSKSSQGT